MSTDTREVLAAAKSALGQLIEAGKAVKAALDATIHDGEPVHPESRRLTWPISSGLLALDAVDAALATQPAQPTVATVTECEACFTPDVCQLRGTCDHYSAQKLRVATQPAQPSAQGEAVAWLVEWKAHGYGPQWWGFNHTPGKSATWCSDANNAIRFARKEDAERMRLHIIAVAGLTGMHEYERSVSVTEHLWEVPCRAE